MPQPTRETRETWTTVSNYSLARPNVAVLALGLVAFAVTYLAAHPTLGAGLLLGIGLSTIVFRLAGQEEGPPQQSSLGQTAETLVYSEELSGRQRATTQSISA